MNDQIINPPAKVNIPFLDVDTLGFKASVVFNGMLSEKRLNKELNRYSYLMNNILYFCDSPRVRMEKEFETANITRELTDFCHLINLRNFTEFTFEIKNENYGN